MYPRHRLDLKPRHLAYAAAACVWARNGDKIARDIEAAAPEGALVRHASAAGRPPRARVDRADSRARRGAPLRSSRLARRGGCLLPPARAAADRGLRPVAALAEGHGRLARGCGALQLRLDQDGARARRRDLVCARPGAERSDASGTGAVAGPGSEAVRIAGPALRRAARTGPAVRLRALCADRLASRARRQRPRQPLGARIEASLERPPRRVRRLAAGGGLRRRCSHCCDGGSGGSTRTVSRSDLGAGTRRRAYCRGASSIQAGPPTIAPTGSSRSPCETRTGRSPPFEQQDSTRPRRRAPSPPSIRLPAGPSYNRSRPHA